MPLTNTQYASIMRQYDDIKTANTGSSVFLKATIQILDAIEDIVLPITI